MKEDIKRHPYLYRRQINKKMYLTQIGVKHWHGAAPDSCFQYLAIEVPGEGTSTEWCEAVDADEYNKLK